MPSSSASHSSGPNLSLALKKLEPVKSLSRVARLVKFDIAVVTRTSSAYKSARELIDAAKAKPDALTYGFGSGTGQVSSAAFSTASGMKVRGIPYKGQPAAITDLLGGQVDFVSSDLGAVLPFLRQGNLSALAVLSDRRSSLLPDVPTAREAGFPATVLTGWIGIDGPAKLPPDVLDWWTEQMRQTLTSPAVVEKMRNIGMEVWPLEAPPFVRFVETELERWGQHVRDAGIQPE